MVKENGPWNVDVWPSGRMVLQSDDFTHDVALEISGDFATQAQKHEYAEEIARRLNSTNPVPNELSSPAAEGSPRGARG